MEIVRVYPAFCANPYSFDRVSSNKHRDDSEVEIPSIVYQECFRMRERWKCIRNPVLVCIASVVFDVSSIYTSVKLELLSTVHPDLLDR
jgi:hypothetical protein